VDCLTTSLRITTLRRSHDPGGCTHDGPMQGRIAGLGAGSGRRLRNGVGSGRWPVGSKELVHTATSRHALFLPRDKLRGSGTHCQALRSSCPLSATKTGPFPVVCLLSWVWPCKAGSNGQHCCTQGVPGQQWHRDMALHGDFLGFSLTHLAEETAEAHVTSAVPRGLGHALLGKPAVAPALRRAR
jgi:hypothetical protein